ncbi:transposase [Streptomyces sp. NPDC029006]|uniref:transposase n=1 Tax=Streptomyces sp. NPDC029006 TaxID=3155467 RepID=UPI00340B8A89
MPPPLVPGWLAGRGGRPEGHCHRQMIDAVRYLVDDGIKWREMPADFPPTLGLLLAVLVTPASVTDRDGARALLPQATGCFRRLARVWADGGYTGQLTDWTSQHLGLVLDIVRRGDDIRGLQALPRRWVVERSFAWLLRSRRLVRDSERRTDTSGAVIRWSMITLMNHRLAAARVSPTSWDTTVRACCHSGSRSWMIRESDVEGATCDLPMVRACAVMFMSRQLCRGSGTW